MIDLNTTVYPKTHDGATMGKKTHHPHKEKSVKGDTIKQEMHLEDGKLMGG